MIVNSSHIMVTHCLDVHQALINLLGHPQGIDSSRGGVAHREGERKKREDEEEE